MKKQEFENWLSEKGISSFGNYISRLGNVESAEGNLDAAYDADRCVSLIAKFTYTRDDQRNRQKPKHNIEIKAQSDSKDIFTSYYEGTNDYKNRITKYVEFRDWLESTATPQTPTDIILTTYNKMVENGKTTPVEKLENGYKLFRDKFSPEKLKNLDGELLLETMFHIGNRDGLFYWMEFKNDEEFNTFYYGSIGGGSSFKYIMFKRSSDGKWVTGNPQNPTILSVDEAIIQGRLLRDALIKGSYIIEQIKTDPTENKYNTLKQKLDEALFIEKINKDLSVYGWVHKYFHMIHPDTIDDFHSTRWQKHGLICLGIKPLSENFYELAGQYINIAQKCQLPVHYVTSAINEAFGSPVNYYRIGTTAGDSANSYWNDMKNGGYVSIGWPEIGDISLYQDQEAPKLREKISEQLMNHYPNDKRAIGRSASQIITFYKELREADVIVASNGEKVLAVGQVSGGYKFEDGLDFPHTIKVEWKFIGETKLPNSKEGLRTTVYQYKDIDNILEVEKLVNSEISDTSIEQDVLLPLPQLDSKISEIENTLLRKKQLILYGPPGTGKTYHAEKACNELAARNHFGKTYSSLNHAEKETIIGTEKKNGVVRICCFHPSYGYEDFIEGIRASVSGGQTVFNLENGIFKELCKDAKDNPTKNYYLIIDEINRGDISRIFGELIMLIEKGKRNKRLLLPLSKESFFVPENVYIIGTMNTADRSIAMLDVALRRRFGFIELMPEYKLFENISFDGLLLGRWLEGLNDRICNNIGRDARNLQIGHAYFLENGKSITNDNIFKRIIKEDVIPLIEEYCYGDYSVLAKVLGESIVNVKKQNINYELFDTSDISTLISALLAPCPELRSDKETTEVAIETDGGDEDEES